MRAARKVDRVAAQAPRRAPGLRQITGFDVSLQLEQGLVVDLHVLEVQVHGAMHVGLKRLQHRRIGLEVRFQVAQRHPLSGKAAFEARLGVAASCACNRDMRGDLAGQKTRRVQLPGDVSDGLALHNEAGAASVPEGSLGGGAG